MTKSNPPLLSIGPDEEFIGRRPDIDRIYRLGLETAGRRRHSTLLVGRRGIGKTEILRRAYNRLFWNQSRVIPLCLTLTKETLDAVAFARHWLGTFMRQVVAFQRKDPSLVNDEAMPFSRATRVAMEHGHPWLTQLVENFEESLADEDWVSMLRNSVAAPLLTARNTALPIFTIVDEFQRIGRLTLNDRPISLAGQFEFILQSHEAPHLLAGSSLRVIERLLGSNLLGRHVERMAIDPLPDRSALHLWELLCREMDVPHDPALGTEVVEQLEGIPLYIQALVRAAAAQGIGLTSLRNIQMVYAHDLMTGEIGSVWGALLEEALPDVTERRPALALLRHLNENPDLGPVPWHRLARVTNLSEDALQSVAQSLERAGFLEIGHTQVYPLADRVLRDWVRMTHRREEGLREMTALRQELTRERLVWATQMRQERAQRHLSLKVEALLSQWDCQRIASLNFNWSAFRELHGGKLFQDIAGDIENLPGDFTLPQVVGVTAAAGAPASCPTLMAFGFEGGRYASGHECLIVVQIHRLGEPVNATQAEEFLDLANRLALPTGVERIHRWVIARGGFTREAVESLRGAKSLMSDFTQLQLILRSFGVHTEEALARESTALGGHDALATGEYTLAIPMEADTELVAASTIEQVASQAGFSEAARGQIKMAVIEACINAREHSGQMGSIALSIRPSDTHLEIIIENPGLVFDSSSVAEPVLEEKLGDGIGLRDKRGWGLKLMRNLMDEVVFEPFDEGTRVRLVKYRAPTSQTPQAPVIDVSKD